MVLLLYLELHTVFQKQSGTYIPAHAHTHTPAPPEFYIYISLEIGRPLGE